MLDKFFDHFGEELSGAWLQALFKPSFFFWAGGFAAWAFGGGQWPAVVAFVMGLPPSEYLAILIGAFVLIHASESAASVIDLPLTRFLEGYWPTFMEPVRRWRVGVWSKVYAKHGQEFQVLQMKKEKGALTFIESERLNFVDCEVLRFPGDLQDVMPTLFGNRLRAAERKSGERYGLDAVVCWPRMWLLMPEGAKAEIQQARASLSKGIAAWFWTAAFLGWTICAWWAVPVSLVGMLVSYRFMISAAEVYGELIESAFDVYRPLLYGALRWAPPASASAEKTTGEALTKYLWRGSVDASIVFKESRE